jgi:hypothetical protein
MYELQTKNPPEFSDGFCKLKTLYSKIYEYFVFGFDAAILDEVRS